MVINDLSESELLEELEKLEVFSGNFSAEDFLTKNPKLASLMSALPHKLKQYVQQIQKIKSEIKSDALNKIDPITSEKKRAERISEIKRIAQEVFIISCAANKVVLSDKETLAFLEKYDITKNLNKIGENGLSIGSAMLISGKDLKVLSEIGLKISLQDLVVADKNEALKNSAQKEEESQKARKQERRPVKKVNSEKNLDSLEEEKARRAQEIRQQQDVINSAIALELHDLQKQAQEIIRLEKAKLAEENRAKIQEEKTKFSAENSKDLAVVEKSKINEVGEKESQKSKINSEQKENSDQKKSLSWLDAIKSSQKLELAKILGISPQEIDINKMLFAAVENNNSILALLLVRYGADVNQTKDGKSVFGLAVEKNNQFLIANFVGNASTENKKTALEKNPNNEFLKSEIINDQTEKNFAKSELKEQKIPPKLSVQKPIAYNFLQKELGISISPKNLGK